MKIFLCIVGVFLALAQVQCETPPELKPQFEECEKEIGVPADLMKTQPDDPKVKCFQACVMKKTGKLVDGKVAVEKVLEYTKKYVSEGDSDSVKAAVTECANKANEEKEECELAGAFYKCYMEKVHHH